MVWVHVYIKGILYTIKLVMKQLLLGMAAMSDNENGKWKIEMVKTS